MKTLDELKEKATASELCLIEKAISLNGLDDPKLLKALILKQLQDIVMKYSDQMRSREDSFYFHRFLDDVKRMIKLS